MTRIEYLEIKLDIFKDIYRVMDNNDDTKKGLKSEIYILERTINELKDAKSTEIINRCLKSLRGE